MTIRTALQSTRKPERELDAPEKQVMHDALRSSVKVVSKPPVDTINIKREVLQEIKWALHECRKMLIEAGFHKESGVAHFTTRVLASLDAVLGEDGG